MVACVCVRVCKTQSSLMGYHAFLPLQPHSMHGSYLSLSLPPSLVRGWKSARYLTTRIRSKNPSYLPLDSLSSFSHNLAVVIVTAAAAVVVVGSSAAPYRR